MRTDKPYAIMVHGALLSSSYMRSLIPLLPQDLDYVCPDLAGHGSISSPDITRDCTPCFFAEDLLDRLVADTLCCPTVLIGHSLGALVVMRLHQMFRSNGHIGIRKIILGDPPLFPIGDTDSQLLAKREMQQSAFGSRILLDTFGEFNSTELSDYYLGLLRECNSPDTEVNVFIGTRETSFREDGSLSCGTFISDASYDRLSVFCETSCDNIRLHRIGGSGHFVFHQEPGTSLLRQLLEESKSL